ncbi:tetratricopeptide repeat protein [Leptospira bouyouniensis]|uniref:Tetratricopeptide repeat protein n=1 Tax=Leptospira bouyouniensis TaxID=2484911 RepID=A0ABY2KYY6_9LEPT|nr:hypothetical protein [Leptospira bouyouniensis]TGK45444.1 hypothetical protein EHQ10_19145 [Leptospira bouyouniensis]
MKVLLFLLLVIIGCGDTKEVNFQKYLIAKGHFLRGDLSNSAKLFKEIYEDDNEFEDVDLHLIKIEFYRGNFQECLSLIDSALENGRWTQQALIYKTRIFLLNPDKKNELLPLVEKMLKLDSSNLDALLLAGKIYSLNNKTSDAITSYNRVLSESKNLRIAHLELSKIYKDLGLKENSEKHENSAKKFSDSNSIEIQSINENVIKKIKSRRK